MNTVYKKIALAGFCFALSTSAFAGGEEDTTAMPEEAAPAADAAAPAPEAVAAVPDEAAPADAAPVEAAAVEAAPVDAAPVEEAPAEAVAVEATASEEVVADAAPSDEAPSEESEGWFSHFDVSFGGFVRPEIAFSTGTANPNNQTGNPFNRKSVPIQGALPPSAIQTTVGNTLGILGVPAGVIGALDPVFTGLTGATGWGTIAIPGVVQALLPNTGGNVQRPVDYEHNLFNLHMLRAEMEMGMTITNDLKFIARVRATYDPGKYKDFNENSVNGIYGGISGGDPALYQGRPNYFQYRVEGNSKPNPLEWAGKNYLVYFPTLLFDYNHGPLNVRLGNQQIAWGQALFFRVLDVVDGLDLRRHSVLDYAQEEFADERVPALALRVGYQFSDELLADAYFQKFQPTIYGNPNTQYNVIPAQFTVHDMYSEGGYDNKYSYGMRVKGNFGQWGFQAMAVRRYNPDGAFRWTKSGVNKSLPNMFANGTLNTFGAVVNAANGGNSGPALAETAFEASPGGVYSSQEWFHYAAMVRLNGLDGLNASIADPKVNDPLTGKPYFQDATQKVFASTVNSIEDARRELDTFFLAGGGSLRGHIERRYFAENNFGVGLSYVTEGEPGSIFDQLIINLENTYTPKRVFTSPDLGQSFLTDKSNVTALVMEKYHRFTQAFPATYVVLQYMHRTTDDIFGRSLKGYGGDDNGPGKGISSANYVALAFQQPFPQDIYRIGFATLYDPKGGILVQPGIVWKPRGYLSVDFFYTYINGKLGGNPNNNALSTADFADEATIRVSYQF